MKSFERSRKELKKLHETGLNRFYTQTRLKKRAIIVSINPNRHCHVLLGLGSGFVLGFITDDRIRVTNHNPNWQLYQYKRSVTFDLSLELLTLTLTDNRTCSFSGMFH